MKNRLFGRTGLRVSELWLGTMTFGEDWGWGASKPESRRIFDAYAKAGGNCIDTANHYTNGTSEKFVGEFTASERQRFVISTKYTLSGRPDDPNAGGNHRKSLVQSLEGSLKRLGTDYIDVYWVHAWDQLTPVEETMRALDDQVRLGKVLYVGFSDAPAWVVSQANTMAALRGWSPFAGIQVQYNLAERTPERELLPMAKALGLAVTAWSPLAGGVLTGKYNKSTQEPKRLTPDSPLYAALVNERSTSIADEVLEIAHQAGRTPSQVALNWLRQRQVAGNVMPILGCRSEKHAQDNLGCLDFELSADDIARLDEASRIRLGFPGDFLASSFVRGLVYGNTFEKTEAPREPVGAGR